MVTKVVSGAQTGVDRGALDAAIDASCPYGGWVPKGRRSEDGCVPARYSAMSETSSANYLKRTEQNVVDSTATVIPCHGAPTGGTLRTVEFCRKHSRPCWRADPDSLLDRGRVRRRANRAELRRSEGVEMPRHTGVGAAVCRPLPRRGAARQRLTAQNGAGRAPRPRADGEPPPRRKPQRGVPARLRERGATPHGGLPSVGRFCYT